MAEIAEQRLSGKGWFPAILRTASSATEIEADVAEPVEFAEIEYQAAAE